MSSLPFLSNKKSSRPPACSTQEEVAGLGTTKSLLLASFVKLLPLSVTTEVVVEESESMFAGHFGVSTVLGVEASCFSNVTGIDSLSLYKDK